MILYTSDETPLIDDFKPDRWVDYGDIPSVDSCGD